MKIRILLYLVNGHSVHVAVVHEPDNLVGEQLAVVLARQVRFSGLGAENLHGGGVGGGARVLRGLT